MCQLILTKSVKKNSTKILLTPKASLKESFFIKGHDIMQQIKVQSAVKGVGRYAIVATRKNIAKNHPIIEYTVWRVFFINYPSFL